MYKLTCASAALENGCEAAIGYIDNKGYTYCIAHGVMTRVNRPCRKLTAAELDRIQNGGSISYHKPTEKFVSVLSVAPLADMPESLKRDKALEAWAKDAR